MNNDRRAEAEVAELERAIRVKPPEQKTWADVTIRALFCPVAQQVVTMADSGRMSREDALIAGLLWLSADRERRVEAEVARLANAPAAPVALQAPTGEVIRAWPK